MSASKEIELGTNFEPKFDSNGLITAISQDAKTGQILMVAYMNKEALDFTIQTGNAVFYSRSRKKLWKKGEESGHFQKVVKILTDCDGDCLLYQVEQEGAACHMGYVSCFYRTLAGEIVGIKVFDPEKVYKRQGH